MSIFIIGHADDPETADTFLPEGVSVHIYAPKGMACPFEIAMRALAGQAQVVDTYSKAIPNYILYTLEPEMGAAAWQVALNYDLASVFIGDNTAQRLPLCNDIPGCRDRGRGHHLCDGVLGYVGQSADKNYHMLACTGDEIAEGTISDTEVRNFILSTSYDGQKALWAGWNDDKKVQMLAWNAIRSWRHNLYLESFCVDNGHGDWAIFRYYASLDDDEKVFFDDPGLNVVIGKGYRDAIARVVHSAASGSITNSMTVENCGGDPTEWNHYAALRDAGVFEFPDGESSESDPEE
ncbi:putative adhesin [Streptomyces sp. NBC_01264]|uniref:putative adhesin n=1 Tax=Streptomyces sp. NBC_01264 TaxID=2903804 RepID=UPI002255404F|nr:hypothetical protein [Streptomyces sp. NBC_01264]MCX4784560.1 hypothetical protein [Streptomyces sp. NBC_01264]